MLHGSLSAALASGAVRYFTGKPCKHGHVAERVTSTRTCVECARLGNSKYRETPEARSIRRQYMAGYSERNRARMQRYGREWKIKSRRAEPDKYKAYREIYTDKNKERIKESARQYRKENRPSILAKERLWIAANRDKVRVKNKSRKARRKGAIGTFTMSDIAAIRLMQKDRCACCRIGLKKRGTVDHIVAIAVGGSNEPSNLQLLCASCNSSKGTRDAIAFMQERGFLL